ncbi:MAG: hypothetical protein AAGG08_00515 [Actinomycetota bacterium]
MSQRHRDTELFPPLREELRAAAHSERHRIHVELQSVAQSACAGGIDPEDLHEPGTAWKPPKHHDAEVAKSKLAKRSRTKRHWKTKSWKRRTQLRQQRVEALHTVREHGFAS